MKSSKTLRAAFYIRVSSEEQAENPEGSIKNQEERLRATLKLKNMDSNWGECVGVYVDRARSGKDTNRPELQKLLAAIERGDVTLVMVTDLSRLTRSIRDFSSIKDLMDRHGCGLLSLRENFDSTTAAGEMVMYLMASLAQFERKQVSERVAANFQARSQRGLYNGGCVPLGYRLDPERKGYLVIDPESAPAVKRAFEAFLEQGSLTKTARFMNEQGYRFRPIQEGGRGRRTGLGHFSFQNVHDVLTNPAYIGFKRFKSKGELKHAKAVWEPIIESDTFEKVQALLKANYCRGKPHEKRRYPFLLAGLTHCSECGERMIGKSAHGNGGKIPYYDHGTTDKRHQCAITKPRRCFPKRVQAKLIEPLVWEKVFQLIREPKLAAAIIEEAKKLHERESAKPAEDPAALRIESIQRRLEALSERLSELPQGVSAEPIYAQMKKLSVERAALEQKHEEQALRRTQPSFPAQLHSYEALLNGLKEIAKRAEMTEAKAKVIKTLVHRVEICPDGLRLHFYAGQQEIGRATEGLRRGYIEAGNNLAIGGSKSLLNGG